MVIVPIEHTLYPEASMGPSWTFERVTIFWKLLDCKLNMSSEGPVGCLVFLAGFGSSPSLGKRLLIFNWNSKLIAFVNT